MENVALFKHHGAEPDEQVAAALDTAVGAIVLSLVANNARVESPADGSFQLRGGARVLAWDRPELHAELLLANLEPELPEGMQIHGAVVGVWRVQAKHDLDECIFDARWASGKVPFEGGPSSGQGLAASTWEDEATVITLGAPDAESLGNNAKAGLPLPESWSATVMVDDSSCVSIEEYLLDGLRLQLPGLRAGELGQVHFAAAWGDAGEDDVAPWYAVDLGPKPLLRLLDSAA